MLYAGCVHTPCKNAKTVTVHIFHPKLKVDVGTFFLIQSTNNPKSKIDTTAPIFENVHAKIVF